MEQFFIVLNQLFIFFLFMVVGVISVKCKVIDELALQYISKLIMRVTMPIMVFHNILSSTTREQILQGWVAIVLSVAVLVFLYFVSTLLSKIFHLKGNRGNVFRAVTMFGNAGYIGIPLISALFPENGILYISIFSMVDQFFLWTVGIHLTTSEDHKVKTSLKGNLKNMINPALVGTILAVIGVLSGVSLPDVLDSGLKSLGAITSPLSLVYIGGLFCFCHLGDILKHLEVYTIIVVKMILFPVGLYLLLSLFPISQELATAMTVIAGLPAMTSIAMFAKANHSDGEYAVEVVVLTTIASLGTLPLITYLLTLF